MKFANGDVFEGQFLNDAVNSTGMVRYQGKVNEGKWCKIKQHGQGKHMCVDGGVYEGEWREDKKHGRSKFTNAH